MKGDNTMKPHYALAAGLVLTTAMAGCMKDEEPGDAIPEGYKKSMEKAEQVEKEMQDAAEERMKDLEGDG